MMDSKAISLEKDQRVSIDVNKDQRNAISSLDYDSLASIFMLLPVSDRLNLEKVCPKWKEASQLAWYDIKKYKLGEPVGCVYDDRLLTPLYVKRLLSKCGIYLIELSLSKICGSRLMPIVGEYCKNLTKLELAINPSRGIYDYSQAFKNLVKLKYIKIELSEDFRGKKLNSRVINLLSKEINEIHLIYKSFEFGEKRVNFSLEKFKKLHALTLNGCILDGIIGKISKMISLVYLDLKDSLITRDCSYKDPHMFSELVHLEYINISGAYHHIDSWKIATPNLPNTIFNSCHNMKHFNVTLPSSSDSTGISIPNWENLKNLEHLNIRWTINSRKIVEYSKNLKHLEISTDNMTESALINLTKLENLEYLVFSDMKDFSNKIIMAISQNSKKLKHLAIPNCKINEENHDDGPDTFSHIFHELTKLEHLEHLNVSSIGKLQDSSVIAIANNCKNLTNLDISYCGNISEEALMSLTSLNKLQVLNVSGLNNVTDNFVMKLKGLKSVSCGCCGPYLTGSGIISLINNCPDLEHFHLFSVRVDIETIIAADKATKNRVNNIILYLYMYAFDDDLIMASTSISESNDWLRIVLG